MCLVISVIALALGYNFFMSENYIAGSASVVIAIGFIVFMIKNILYVKKLKKEKKNDS